jgi:hypothetical protein
MFNNYLICYPDKAVKIELNAADMMHVLVYYIYASTININNL